MTEQLPQGVYFGPSETPLFGWLHSDAAVHRGVGVVVCDPFGFEAVCAHRALRHLADALARRGFPVLRFDALGCGDSSGSPLEAGHFNAQLASVGEAIIALKSLAGVDQICLVGLRLGAVWATLAAAGRVDVLGLVAIAPVVRGRTYLRELRALAATHASGPRGTMHADGIESAGFLMTEQTVQALGDVDLRALPAAPAPNMLIVERDDLPGSEEWASALERLGATVRVARWPGYRGMVDDPQRAMVPVRIVEGVCDWLASLAPPCTAPRHVAIPEAAGPTSCRISEGPATVEERAVRIAPGELDLFGILSAPTSHCSTSTGQRIAVLMLNAGSVHRIGPNRLWVDLARSWAARGFTVLRMDLSGVGDSPARSGAQENVVYSSSAIDDVRRAIEWLREAEGIAECRVLGLCSGAYQGFRAVLEDMHIESAIVINPLTFYWRPGTVLNVDLTEYALIEMKDRYKRKVFALESWRRLLRGDLDLSFIWYGATRQVTEFMTFRLQRARRWMGWTAPGDTASELLQAVEKGAKLHFIFAENHTGYRLLMQRAGESVQRLRAQGTLSLHFIGDADHTFTGFKARKQLVECLNALMLERGARAETAGVNP